MQKIIQTAKLSLSSSLSDRIPLISSVRKHPKEQRLLIFFPPLDPISAQAGDPSNGLVSTSRIHRVGFITSITAGSIRTPSPWIRFGTGIRLTSGAGPTKPFIRGSGSTTNRVGSIILNKPATGWPLSLPLSQIPKPKIQIIPLIILRVQTALRLLTLPTHPRLGRQRPLPTWK